MNKHDYKTKKHKNQDLSTKKSSFQVEFPSLDIKTLENETLALASSSVIPLRLLNIIFSLQNSFQTVYPSVKTMADYAGCSRKTIHEYLNKAENIFFKREQRDYQSNIYHINPSFLGYRVRKQLKKYFPALAALPFFLLATAVVAAQTKRQVRLEMEVQRTILDYENYVTLLKKDISYLKTLLPTASYHTRDLHRLKVNKKGKMMKLPEYLQNPPVKLSMYGKIRLSAFNEQAVYYAFGKYTGARGIKNPFGFIYSSAMNHHAQTQGLEPDWSTYYRLMEAHPDVKATDDAMEKTAQGSFDKLRMSGPSPKEARGFKKEGGYNNPIPIKPEYQNDEVKVHCYYCSLMNNKSTSPSVRALWEKKCPQREGWQPYAGKYVDRRSTAESFLASLESKSPTQQEELIKNREHAPMSLQAACKDVENIPTDHPFYGYFLKDFLNKESVAPQPPDNLQKAAGVAAGNTQNTNEIDQNLIEEDEYNETSFEW